MSESKVEINVPQELIKTIVLAEVAESLGGREEIIAGVVKEILTSKRDTYRNTETFVIEQFGEMVKEEAGIIVKELINERRSEIKAEIEKQLTTKRWAKLASNAVIAGIEHSYMSLNISFKSGE